MELVLVVKEIFDEWDPINLTNVTPDDEYDPEINEIVELLPTVETIDELASEFHQICIKWFGEDTIDADNYSLENCYPVSIKIWNKLY